MSKKYNFHKQILQKCYLLFLSGLGADLLGASDDHARHANTKRERRIRLPHLEFGVRLRLPSRPDPRLADHLLTTGRDEGAHPLRRLHLLRDLQNTELPVQCHQRRGNTGTSTNTKAA